MKNRRESVTTSALAPAPLCGDLPAIAHEDPFPRGPYKVGLTKYPKGVAGRPYTVVCGDGRAVCGWVESRACVEAIVAALNVQYPA